MTPVKNYWEVGYKTRIISKALAGSTSKYLLNQSDEVIDNARRLVAISHRSPNANAYTLDGKKLVTSPIYDAAILNLKDHNGGEVLTIPLSALDNRSGGDNNILMLPAGLDVDLVNGKSYIEIQAPSGTITTASGNSEAFELVLWFEPNC